MHKLIYRGFSSFLIWRIHLPHLINIHSGSFLWALNCIIKTERVKTNLIFFLKMILVHIFQSSSLFFPCTRSCSKYDFFTYFLLYIFNFAHDISSCIYILFTCLFLALSFILPLFLWRFLHVVLFLWYIICQVQPQLQLKLSMMGHEDTHLI